MASGQRKPGSGGRVTPKGGIQRTANAQGSNTKSPNGKAPNSRRPQDPETPVSIGRRPSSPRFLALVAVMWMAVGVILFLTLNTGWRLIPAIVAFGIGVMFLRGAVSTVLRRERRRSSGE